MNTSLEGANRFRVDDYMRERNSTVSGEEIHMLKLSAVDPGACVPARTLPLYRKESATKPLIDLPVSSALLLDSKLTCHPSVRVLKCRLDQTQVIGWPRMRIVFFALLSAGFAVAQTPSATLVGRITDGSHAGVPGANIEVRNVNTNESRTAQSQFDGEYTVSNLPPGTYEVIVDKTGFRRLHESNLDLQVEQTARLDAQLQVGATTETVEVKADVPLLNTET